MGNVIQFPGVYKANSLGAVLRIAIANDGITITDANEDAVTELFEADLLDIVADDFAFPTPKAFAWAAA